MASSENDDASRSIAKKAKSVEETPRSSSPGPRNMKRLMERVLGDESVGLQLQKFQPGLAMMDWGDDEQFLRNAAANGHAFVVSVIAAAGAPVSDVWRDPVRTWEEWSLLSLAAHNGQLEVVDALLRAQ
ncbi:unnamed protein product, partial [Heterosigma akashiwo]